MNGDDVNENFVCMICTQLANSAVETLCCGQIMCQQCVNDLQNRNHLNCPNCREKLNVKASVLARRMISSIKLPCQQCNQKFAHKDIKAHKTRCPEKTINCKDCSKEVRIKHILEHMREQHIQALTQICLDYQLGPKQVPSMSKISSVKSDGDITDSRIRSNRGRQCHLGTTNKYYCGQRSLIGKCGCCDGRCGPTNGQNCDDCMEADVKRFKLEKGYLVNTQGVVCKLDRNNGQFYCGRMLANRTFCSKGSGACGDCRRVSNSVRLGRYKSLV